VEHSKQEYDIQQTLRHTQTITSSNQEIINQQTSNFKNQYRAINQRFQVLGAVMQALATSLESVDLVNKIIHQQNRIAQALENDQSKILLAVQSEVEILGRAHKLARYVLGLMISYGDINQMKQSDRRILYAHVITELKSILNISTSLYNSIYYASLMKKLNSKYPFVENILADKTIVENILAQLKSIKQ